MTSYKGVTRLSVGVGRVTLGMCSRHSVWSQKQNYLGLTMQTVICLFLNWKDISKVAANLLLLDVEMRQVLSTDASAAGIFSSGRIVRISLAECESYFLFQYYNVTTCF